MGNLKWYKRDPRAALVGMLSLSLTERGAYNTLLDLIYCNDGALKDDLPTVAHQMHVDLRSWKHYRQRLLDLGKIYIKSGYIHNERADKEVAEALGRSHAASTAGTISAVRKGYRNIRFNPVENSFVHKQDRPKIGTDLPSIQNRSKVDLGTHIEEFQSLSSNDRSTAVATNHNQIVKIRR